MRSFGLLSLCLLLSGIFSSLLLLGCDELEQKGAGPPQTTMVSKPHYQRFLPVPPVSSGTVGVPWNGYFALDTKTGQLCRTVGVVFSGASYSVVNNAPLCSVLYTSYPD